MSATLQADALPKTATGRIVLASLVGTAIEFYDFYIYGTAAALVLGKLFWLLSGSGVVAGGGVAGASDELLM